MKKAFLVIFFLSASRMLIAQNYTSLADGAWTTPGNWNNTSGWGTSTPPLNYSSGTISANHNLTISSAANFGGSGFNLASGKTITSAANFTFSNGTSNINGTINVTGNFTASGGTTNIYGTVNATGNLSVSSGATINVYGTMTIDGNASLNANLVIQPGGKVIIKGSVTVSNSTYLTVGTNVAPPPYADLVIYQNLIQQSSGDVTINQNGRLAVFGNVTDSGGGGTFIRVNNGGQAYVHGNVTYSGGGSAIQNNNTTSPYGLYVNGTTTSSGGGGSVTSNLGDEVTMQNTNSTFYNWVTSQPNNPLPIVLIYFRIKGLNEHGISLAWATTMEKNFDRFELERATSDLEFTSITTIQGKGGLDIKTSYEFLDTNPARGKNYYRLKSIDFDNSFEYSHVIVADWDGISDGISLYPNPVTNRSFTLELKDVLATPVTVKVIESRGYIVYESEIGTQTSTVNLPENLGAGIYFVKISSAHGQQVIRIVVAE